MKKCMPLYNTICKSGALNKADGNNIYVLYLKQFKGFFFLLFFFTCNAHHHHHHIPRKNLYITKPQTNFFK